MKYISLKLIFELYFVMLKTKEEIKNYEDKSKNFMHISLGTLLILIYN